MADKIYPKGFKIWQPRESAPPWLKGRVSVHLETFTEWAKDHVDDKGYVSLDLKDGADGLYTQLNTWKPNNQSPASLHALQDVDAAQANVDYPKDDINPEDIPF